MIADVDGPLRIVGGGMARLATGPDDRLALQPATEDSTELFIGPGWVDLHAHIYDGMTSLSVHPDRVGLAVGVHVLADAGSSGAATIDGLAKYVRPTARTEMRAWLNIGSHGLVDMRETADLRLIDVDSALAAIDRHRDFVCGVKVRSSGAIVGNMGLQPLQLGRLVARAAGLPLLVHIGEAPPLIDDVLDLLDSGDVITHCYHGKPGGPWLADGQPGPALRRAVERGVHLDVGHGGASFSFAVAERAIAAGYPPNSISTDIHIRNIDGPVYDLATTMTKLLACGMELTAVIAAVTAAPRQILRLPADWLDADGVPRHGTIFRLAAAAPDRPEYRDAVGQRRVPDRHIIPVATITAGQVELCRAAISG